MDTLNISQNFLALESALSEYQSSPVVIQSLPYEYTSSYKKGSAHGPEAILKASHYVEFYDEELDRETVVDIGGIATLPILQFAGKINEEAMNLIATHTRNLLNDNKFVVSLGAEHTVTYGVLKAFTEKFGNNFAILQIDAHSDLRESYHDNPFSHASVMARCRELNLSLTQVGIRAQCIEESIVCKKDVNITTLYAHDLDAGENWITKVINSLPDNVYVTIDADGFDPSVMPSVGTPEPNGLSWQQGIRLLKKVAAQKNIIGFDVVELLPRDSDTLTEYNCAKLIYKLIGYINQPKK